MKKGISASMMCADIMNLKSELEILEQAKIEYLHIDIMDGEFVPNYSMGKDYISALRKNTKIPLDIHMMVNKPEVKLSYLDLQAGDAVSIHIESSVHIQRVLSDLKSKGIMTGVAYNPATGLETLKYVADVIDYVLIMTVNPGYAGQKLVPLCLDRIKEARKIMDSLGKNQVLIEVDGNVSFKNAKIMKEKGADIFVVGSSSIFDKSQNMTEAINKFRAIVNE